MDLNEEALTGFLVVAAIVFLVFLYSISVFVRMF